MSCVVCLNNSKFKFFFFWPKFWEVFLLSVQRWRESIALSVSGNKTSVSISSASDNQESAIFIETNVLVWSSVLTPVLMKVSDLWKNPWQLSDFVKDKKNKNKSTFCLPQLHVNYPLQVWKDHVQILIRSRLLFHRLRIFIFSFSVGCLFFWLSKLPFNLFLFALFAYTS